MKANPKGDPEAFRILADNNGKAADWLKSIGAPLSVTNNPFSVTSNREAGPLGLVITSALAAEMKKAGVDTVSYTHLDVYKRQVFQASGF